MFGPIHATYTAEQLQEIKGRGRKEGDTRVRCCTHPYKKHALSLRGQAVWWRNTWLGRGPNLLNLCSLAAFVLKQHNKRGLLLCSILFCICKGEVNTEGLCLGCWCWGVGEWIGEKTRERQREGRADLQCVRQQGQPIPGEVLAF